MEPDDERCLDLMRPSKDIATEIHPHYNEVFQQQHLTALYPKISDGSQAIDGASKTLKRFGTFYPQR